MAVGWVTALKLVPWGGVIEATPQLLQAARKLMGHKNAGADAEAGTLAGAEHYATATTATTATTRAAQQIQRLEDRVTQLEADQQESARLIQSLAEQNARVVQAMAALRRQARWHTVALGVLTLCCVGLITWVVLQ